MSFLGELWKKEGCLAGDLATRTRAVGERKSKAQRELPATTSLFVTSRDLRRASQSQLPLLSF